MFILVLCALLMGAILGLLGGGGAVITVPSLIYAGKISAKDAIATGLAVVGFVSTIAGLREWRAGRVHLAKAIPFSLCGMVGSFVGARLATAYLDDDIQLVMFGVVVMISAGLMIRNATKGRPQGDGQSGSTVVLCLAGAGVGAMGGALGLGGGFLIVPALVLVAGMEMKESIGTALVIVALNAFAGVAGYLGKVTVHWNLFGLFAVAGLVGSVAGAGLRSRVPEKALKLVFAGFLILVGAYMLLDKSGVI